jgi:hypothetical protein
MREPDTSAGASRLTSPRAGHGTPVIDEATQDYLLDDLSDLPPEFGPEEHVSFAADSYRGLFRDFFPEKWQETYEHSVSRKRITAQTLRQFERFPSVWKHETSLCLMHAHLSCLVAWNKHISGDSPETKRSKGPPPRAPLTLFELIVDTIPTFDGLRAFYLACAQQPANVLDAFKRRLRWHEHYGGEVHSHAAFEEQAGRIVGAYFMTTLASDAVRTTLQDELRGSETAVLFGATHLPPFDDVTEFLRSLAERGQNTDHLHWFLNVQYRHVAWPCPRLRFEPGQVVWVAWQCHHWVGATVLETSAPPAEIADMEDGTCRYLAAYMVQVIASSQDLLHKIWPIAYDSDHYIRKKRPPQQPAPGPAPEDPRVAWQRREAHDRREAMERARELENERLRKARVKEEKRRSDEEEERRRLSSVHAAQAAARAATREPAPWPADMPLRGNMIQRGGGEPEP